MIIHDRNQKHETLVHVPLTRSHTVKHEWLHHNLSNSTQTADWWATALTVMLPRMRCTAIWSQGETWFATSTFECSSLTSLFSSFTRMPNTIHKECNTKLQHSIVELQINRSIGQQLIGITQLCLPKWQEYNNTTNITLKLKKDLMISDVKHTHYEGEILFMPKISSHYTSPHISHILIFHCQIIKFLFHTFYCNVWKTRLNHRQAYCSRNRKQARRYHNQHSSAAPQYKTVLSIMPLETVPHIEY